MTSEEMKIIEKMLKDTYLTVANMDLHTEYIGDTQAVAASKFRQIMVEKLHALEQDPCGEYISKEDAVRAVKNLTLFYPDERGNLIVGDGKLKDHTVYRAGSVEKAIRKVTPVTPFSPWIPINKGLPKETGWYLVTFPIYGGGYEVCELSYRKPENYWTTHNTNVKALDNSEIIAWMPRPQPYDGGAAE